MVYIRNILESLRELADKDFQQRAWLASSGPEVSSFTEAIEGLITDSGLGSELEESRTVFSEIIDSKFNFLSKKLLSIESRHLSELIEDPKMEEVRVLAGELTDLLSQEYAAEDSHIIDYTALGPYIFRRVERLEIRQSLEKGYESCLELVLRHVDPNVNHRLFLTFNGVRNLSLMPQEKLPLSMYLDIRCLGNRKQNGMNYSVRDTEYDTISFLCRNFTARVE